MTPAFPCADVGVGYARRGMPMRNNAPARMRMGMAVVEGESFLWILVSFMGAVLLLDADGGDLQTGVDGQGMMKDR